MLAVCFLFPCFPCPAPTPPHSRTVVGTAVKVKRSPLAYRSTRPSILSLPLARQGADSAKEVVLASHWLGLQPGTCFLFMVGLIISGWQHQAPARQRKCSRTGGAESGTRSSVYCGGIALPCLFCSTEVVAGASETFQGWPWPGASHLLTCWSLFYIFILIYL